MTREDIDRIASEYFDDKESEHEMDEVFDLAKNALEERKADVLEQISEEVDKLKKVSDGNKVYVGINDVLDIVEKYR